MIIRENEPPVSLAQIREVEIELGVSLPDDYRNFLMRNNGGYPEPDGFSITWRSDQAPASDWKTSTLSRFYAITEERTSNLLRSNKVTFAGRLPTGTITIATDAGGNQLLLALGGPLAGKVLFWVKDHEVGEGQTPVYDNVGIVADSFSDLINSCLH